METITLSRGTWTFDSGKQLGVEGGFGAVFEGHSPSGEPVAIKRLKISSDEAEHRELRMAEALMDRSLPHVMPVLDSGLDKNSGRYFVVMPRAERSLHDHIVSYGPLQEADAIGVLHAIASGLTSLGDLVHRDMKPHNILLHDGNWKIADFGIARFVEDATSARTLKDCMSRPYAAPEQWRMERATKATDVYAVGCIAYALLTGRPPFPGPASHDYQRQHTQEDPPSLTASAMVRQIVASCLRKSPDARPRLDSLEIQLARAKAKLNDQQPDPLAHAAAHIAAEEAAKEIARGRATEALQRRSVLARDGMAAVQEILNDLYQEVCHSSTVAQRTRNGVQMGHGGLEHRVEYNLVPPTAFEKSQWKDVVVGVVLRVTQNNPRFPGRSANLWYANIDGSYQWWEASYWSWGRLNLDGPSALFGEDGLRLAALVVSGVTSGVQFVHRPRRIDAEHRDDFVTRWKGWLAQASLGRLERPSRLPEENC